MKWMAVAVVAMSVVAGCATGSNEPVTDGVAGSAAQTPVTAGGGATPHSGSARTTAPAPGDPTAPTSTAASKTAAPAAGDPAAPTSTAASKTAAPAAGIPAPTTTAAASKTPAPADSSAKPVNRALIAQGYQPSTYRGQLYYCRKQKLTGSQFTQRVCLTEHEAALQERIAQDEMNKRNSAGKCLPPLCPKH
jgi:hypothetical protein